MFSTLRTATLALAAVASLGLATLVTSTTSADAMRGGGFSGGARGGMSHSAPRSFGGQRHFGSPRLIGGDRISRTPRHIGRDRISRTPHFVHRRHHNWCHITRRCGIHVRFHRPWIYGTSVVATGGYAVAPTYAAAPAPRCTCLTKEYTQDGQVVFQDLCTKEAAAAPIGTTQAQLPMPQQQAPVQQ